MTALRCTAKLMKRLRIDDPGEPPPPENALGDWFANILYTRQGHYVLLVSDRSLLPVLTTARDLDNLVPRFLHDLRDVLTALQVPSTAIDRELGKMQPVYYGRTNSRAVLGSMTDFAEMLKCTLASEPDLTLLEWSLFLAQAPCSPIGMESPDDVAPRLLKNPHGFTVLNGGDARCAQS